MIMDSGNEFCNDPAMVHALVCMKSINHAMNFSVTASNNVTTELFKITPPEVTAIIVITKKHPVINGNTVTFGEFSFELHGVSKREVKAFHNAVKRAIREKNNYWACENLIDQYKTFANNEHVVW